MRASEEPRHKIQTDFTRLITGNQDVLPRDRLLITALDGSNSASFYFIGIIVPSKDDDVATFGSPSTVESDQARDSALHHQP